MLNELQTLIENAYETRQTLSPSSASDPLRAAINTVVKGLNDGTLRVASHTPSGWQVHAWIKKAVLLYFATHVNRPIQGSHNQYFDKVALKFSQYTPEDWGTLGARVVPPAYVRTGAYIGPNTVIMPSYINIGAYVGRGTLIDTWATVGSCAQIGENVHISGGVGIGGVLEPLQASPVIIEDNCFIGARSEIVEGVIVKKNAVISMGVFLGQSTRIYDRTTGKITYGVIPEGAVVVPGSLPSQDGKCHLNAAIIVKHVDEKTRAKTSINELLRNEIS